MWSYSGLADLSASPPISTFFCSPNDLRQSGQLGPDDWSGKQLLINLRRLKASACLPADCVCICPLSCRMGTISGSTKIKIHGQSAYFVGLHIRIYDWLYVTLHSYLHGIKIRVGVIYLDMSTVLRDLSELGTRGLVRLQGDQRPRSD